MKNGYALLEFGYDVMRVLNCLVDELWVFLV